MKFLTPRTSLPSLTSSPSLEPQVSDFSHFPLVQVSSTQEDTIVLEAIGIQCKSRTNLLDVMES